MKMKQGKNKPKLGTSHRIIKKKQGNTCINVTRECKTNITKYDQSMIHCYEPEIDNFPSEPLQAVLYAKLLTIV